MKVCRDCDQPIPYGLCYGDVCPKCRGKRSALILKQKRDKHGPHYTSRRPDERREAP